MERDRHRHRSSDRRLTSFFAFLRPLLSESKISAKALKSQDSSSFYRECAGFIFPESKQDVLHVVEAANRFGVAIDPVSTGLNIGYGDYFPEARGQVVVDLRRMNRILEFNRDEGWIRIQPGVTQGDVAGFLKTHAPEYDFDLTYWLQESSVIGNSLERGRTLLSEREKDLIGAELVLGSGQVLRTGFDPEQSSPIGHGINLHPLIFQSNLGVVIEGVVKLRRVNPIARYHLIGFERVGDLVQTLLDIRSLSGIRPLRWYCAKTFKSTPVPRSIQTRFQDLKGGVLVTESLATHTLRTVLAAKAPIRREALIAAPTLDIVPRDPVCFYSFAVRATELAHAQRKIASWQRRFPFRFFQTTSFLEQAPVILLRVHADPAQHLSQVRHGFSQLSSEIEASGYIFFRDHSGLTTKNWTDTELKKMIKNAFDPRGIISPGRYSV